MSVYKRQKSRLWHYDFQLKGRRFHGSTGQANRRAAEAVERDLRLKAALGQTGAAAAAAAYSIDEAAGRWWLEAGQHRGDAAKLHGRALRLVQLFGPATRIAEIDQTAVAAAIERHRGAPFSRSNKKGARQYLRANATVNRDVIETLRPILRRAATHWGAGPLPEIDWRELRLREPLEQVRVYSLAEQAAWLAACEGQPEREALDLMLTDGLRFGELFFPPAAFEAEGPRLAWMKGRKRDIPHTVPLLPRQAAWLAERVRRALAAGLDHIWFEETLEAGGGGDGQPPAIVLKPITYWMMEGRISRAADRAGIRPGRRIHGARHHAGTRVLRKSKGNFKAVQRLLGHRDIRSSQRYAHLLEDDLRDILEAAETPDIVPTPRRARAQKPRKSKA